MKDMGGDLNALSGGVIGAAIEVHRELGPGFVEGVYEGALCVELTQRNIPFVRQCLKRVSYKDNEVGQVRLDLLVDDRIVVELKAIESLTSLHAAQVKNYLKATGIQLGLLINFNCAVLKEGIKRIVLT